VSWLGSWRPGKAVTAASSTRSGVGVHTAGFHSWRGLVQSGPKHDSSAALGSVPDMAGWRQALFPQPPDGQLTKSKALLALVALVAGTVLGLSRVRGPGAWNTVWAEDGGQMLNDAYHHSLWHALTTPLNGYYVTVPRLFGALAAAVPVPWAAWALATTAALLTSLLALLVYTASRAHLDGPVLRLAVSAPVVATPVGALFTPHLLVTLQFIAIYATFWTLLWTPRTRGGRIVALLLLVGVVALLRPSSPLGWSPSAWPANAWPIMMYLTLTAVVCAANLRPDNARAMSQPWSQVVAQASVQCRTSGSGDVLVSSGSPWWGGAWPLLRIPCRRLP
jgi:hypothetical protein